MVAHGGKTSPELFRAAMTSSTYLPSQYPYDGAVPEVGLFVVLAHSSYILTTERRQYTNKLWSRLGEVHRNMHGIKEELTCLPVQMFWCKGLLRLPNVRGHDHPSSCKFEHLCGILLRDIRIRTRC